MNTEKLFKNYQKCLIKQMSKKAFNDYLNALGLYVKKETIEERIDCINNFLTRQKLETMFKMCSDNRVLTNFSDCDIYQGIKKLHAKVVNRYITYILIARVFVYGDDDLIQDLYECLSE